MRESGPTQFSDRERLDRLRLIRSENVGPITFRRLLERFGTAAAALAALPELARRGGRGQVRLCSEAEAEAEVHTLDRRGARAVFLGEAVYPPLLAAIDDAPAVISVMGEVRLLSRPTLGVVGSRNASLNGRRLAGMLSRDLGVAGWVVVSGLARGIDTAAHDAALPTGTVAVLAGGVDVCYPPENADLYEGIAREGVIVAEAPPGTAPQARHFPRRNRLISGLARGVLVVEANLRSGSLITARLAAEQGREVFAVPGSPLDPRARGCNDLLRQGAVLVEEASDVLAVVGLADPGHPRSRTSPAQAEDASPPLEFEGDHDPAGGEIESARRRVAETLSPAPVTVDEIVRACQLSPAVVSTILLEWELAGRLERHPGNRVSSIA